MTRVVESHQEEFEDQDHQIEGRGGGIIGQDHDEKKIEEPTQGVMVDVGDQGVESDEGPETDTVVGGGREAEIEIDMTDDTGDDHNV